MADFTSLKTAIQNAIKLNGNEEITGDILQGVLLSMVSTLGDSAINDLVTAISNEATARQNGDSTLNGYIESLQGAINSINTAIGNGYVYAGIATPSSTPASGKVFYLALTAGTYTNFGNTEVSQGINILKYDGSDWSLDVVISFDNAPTPSSNNLVKSGGVFDKIMTDGSAFDISAHFASGGTLATYADLSAALTALNALPAAYKKGGMSIKFVRTSDNKYVRYDLSDEDFTTDVNKWQNYNESKNSIKNNLGVAFEYGGLSYNGVETTESGFVRTLGFLQSPFKIEVNNGYQLCVAVYYDKKGTPIGIQNVFTSGTTTWEYNEGFIIRLVISKNPANASISPADSIIKSYESAEDLRLDAIEDVVYDSEELTFEQGGLNPGGVEVASDNYIRSGFINPNFSLYLKDGYRIIVHLLYDKDGKYVSIAEDYTSRLLYSGEYKVRVVIAKNPLAQISPSDDFIKYFYYSRDNQFNKIDRLEEKVQNLEDIVINGTDGKIVLEQGGIWGDGSESTDTNYVRNRGYISNPFSISVNSGYKIIQYVFYDENNDFVSYGMYDGTSYSYNGPYKVRLVFRKEPIGTISPRENIIASFVEKVDSLVKRIKGLENTIMIAHDLQSVDIYSPKTFKLCFFDKLMRVSYEDNDPKLNKSGLWSDGSLWRNIVDNNLFVTAHGFKTIKISDGQAIAELNEDYEAQIHSVTKLMNLAVVCDSGIALSTTVTVTENDKSTSGWYQGFVDVGDEVTIYDLMCSAVIISDNTACQTLARVVGYILNPNATTDAEARNAFIAAMNTKAQSIGMSNTTYYSAYGASATSTPTDQCKLAKEIYTNSDYAEITNKWGLLSYQMAITGTNARTYTIYNEINESIRATYLPGFVGGKPGQGNYGTLLFVWKDANNVAYATYIEHSVLYGGNCCYPDARRVIDYTKELL